MCCFLTILLMLGPRAAGVIWWLARPMLWNAAFSSVLWPILGLIFVPWTTLMYILVAGNGVTGFDWLWIGLSVLADIASYGGGAYGNRDHLPMYSTPKTL